MKVKEFLEKIEDPGTKYVMKDYLNQYINPQSWNTSIFFSKKDCAYNMLKGFIWGAYAYHKITEQEQDELLSDLIHMETVNFLEQ